MEIQFLHEQILQRNARETDPFVSVHKANATLLNQVDAWQSKCEGYERDISSLQQELDELAAATTATTSTGSGNSSRNNHNAAATAALKNETRLRDKLETLQEELNQKLQLHASDQASALKTAQELSALKDVNTAQEATIQNLRKENERQERVIEHLTEQLQDAKGRTKLAEQQYVGLKETIRGLQKENDALVKENHKIEERLVADKGKMSDEMNVLTEMVDRLKAEVDMLRSFKIQEEQRSSIGSSAVGSWFGRAASAPTQDNNKSPDKDKDKDNSNTRKFGMLGVIVPSKPKQMIQAHMGSEATSVRYDGLGADLVATGGTDSLVKVWDVGTGTLRSTLRGSPGHTVMGVDMCGSLVVGASSDKTCRVWNMRTERMIHHLVGHGHKVTCVRFFDSGHAVISGSADRSLKVWDIRARTYRQTVTLRHSSTSHCVDTGSNGVDVVSGHHDGGLRFWDVRVGDRTMDIAGMHENTITSVQFNPADATQVLTNGLDSCLKVVDIRTGSAIHTLRDPQFHTSQGWSASAFSGNGAYAAAGSSSNGNIFVWDLNDGSLKAKLEGHTAGVCGFAWGRGGSSGQQVASVDRKGGLILWA